MTPSAINRRFFAAVDAARKLYQALEALAKVDANYKAQCEAVQRTWLDMEDRRKEIQLACADRETVLWRMFQSDPYCITERWRTKHYELTRYHWKRIGKPYRITKPTVYRASPQCDPWKQFAALQARATALGA